MPKELESRRALRNARRVLIKAGTSVVANDDGRPSLTRLGSICEQIAELHRNGVQIIMVSSGATGMGKRLMRKHGRMNMTMAEVASFGENIDQLSNADQGGGAQRTRSESGDAMSERFFSEVVNTNERPHSMHNAKKTYDSACAAAGQFEMMNLYNALFSQMEISAAQVLLTEGDFRNQDHLSNLHYSIERLLNLGIIPIVNENDAISANRGYTEGDLFSDNDSLAALCARSFACDLCILLTDVDGVFDRPPSEKGAKLLSFYSQEQSVGIGEKSKHGRGGMASKISAAQSAVKPGSKTRACVVVSGTDLNAIRSLTSKAYDGTDQDEPKGTLFATPGSPLEQQALKEIAAAKVRNVDMSSLWHYAHPFSHDVHLMYNFGYCSLIQRCLFLKMLAKWQLHHVMKQGSFNRCLIRKEKLSSTPLQTPLKLRKIPCSRQMRLILKTQKRMELQLNWLAD